MAKLIKRYRFTFFVMLAILCLIVLEDHFDLAGNTLWYLIISAFSLMIVFVINYKLLEMEYVSTTDTMTQLKNHHTFWLDFTENRSGPRTLILIDVDHFKKVNDTYGHLAGNEMLKGYGSLFNSFFLGVGQTYRFGGEEFAVLLEGVDNNKAHDMASALHQIISQREDLNSVSMGLVSTQDSLKDVHDMFRLADKALYKAKEFRNTVVNAGYYKDDFEIEIETI